MQLLQILDGLGKLSLHGQVALVIEPSDDVVGVSHVNAVAMCPFERYEQSQQEGNREQAQEPTQNLVLYDGHASAGIDFVRVTGLVPGLCTFPPGCRNPTNQTMAQMHSGAYHREDENPLQQTRYGVLGVGRKLLDRRPSEEIKKYKGTGDEADSL